MGQAAMAFGMKVLAYDPAPPQNLPPGLRMADLDAIFTTSDAISLHCPLTDSNRHMVNAERLSQMKPTAFLINAGRGPLIDERRCAEALDAGASPAPACDVLAVEPPPADHPLLKAKNCYITPHDAWGKEAARGRLFDEAIESIRAFSRQKAEHGQLTGNSSSIVQPPWPPSRFESSSIM